MSDTIRGRVLLFGDDVNTDLLHPSYFFSLDDDKVREGFLGAVEGRENEAGDGARILVAGRNFGCGSSRETTLRSLKLSGVQALVAVSFGRIFFRNALSVGLPAFTCASLRSDLAEGDEVAVDPLRAVARIMGNDREIALDPLDPFWAAVLGAGGLMPFLKSRGEVPA